MAKHVHFENNPFPPSAVKPEKRFPSLEDTTLVWRNLLTLPIFRLHYAKYFLFCRSVGGRLVSRSNDDCEFVLTLPPNRQFCSPPSTPPLLFPPPPRLDMAHPLLFLSVPPFLRFPSTYSYRGPERCSWSEQDLFLLAVHPSVRELPRKDGRPSPPLVKGFSGTWFPRGGSCSPRVEAACPSHEEDLFAPLKKPFAVLCPCVRYIV